jgi:uncharacterized damage-inducible protein DinB
MTSREFFVETLKDELPRFERVFRALPESRLDYKPHEKSRSASELLGVFADEAQMFPAIIEKGVVDMTGFIPASYTKVADAVAAFGRGFDGALRAAASSDEEQWKSTARLVMGDKVVWETTRGAMAWGLILDLVHHRGQLSVYLRPMGAQVPAIYGPSGDAAE